MLIQNGRWDVIIVYPRAEEKLQALKFRDERSAWRWAAEHALAQRYERGLPLSITMHPLEERVIE